MDNKRETANKNQGQRSFGNYAVSQQKWQEAQEWEWKQWAQRDKPLLRPLLFARQALSWITNHQQPVGDDDWNRWWAKRFNDYELLPKELCTAIELGSGPYTNVRFIKKHTKIKRIVCSDPLADRYAGLKHGWLSKAYRKGEILLDTRPIEDIDPGEESYDLVILINVLDHVKDAELSLRHAMSLTASGGILIFGQDLTNEEDLKYIGADMGHPIRVDKDWVDDLLMRQFAPVFYRILSRECGRNRHAHYGTYLFIGKRNDSDRTSL